MGEDKQKNEEKEEKKEGVEKEKKARAKKKKKIARQVPVGVVHVHASYNNTLISLTDQQGNVLGWSSAGAMGFRGPRKATPYAASMVIRNLAEKVQPYGVREVYVKVSGIGGGRDSAVRALNANGINVLSIKDVTPIPHNGCRPPRPRRV